MFGVDVLHILLAYPLKFVVIVQSLEKSKCVQNIFVQVVSLILDDQHNTGGLLFLQFKP